MKRFEIERRRRRGERKRRRNDKVSSEWLFPLCQVYVRKRHLRAERKRERER